MAPTRIGTGADRATLAKRKRDADRNYYREKDELEFLQSIFMLGEDLADTPPVDKMLGYHDDGDDDVDDGNWTVYRNWVLQPKRSVKQVPINLYPADEWDGTVTETEDNEEYVVYDVVGWPATWQWEADCRIRADGKGWEAVYVVE